jgi:hypothetical protein
MPRPTSEEETRKRSRITSAISILVQKEDLGQSIPARIKDLNWYGAGLEVESLVREGDTLLLAIPIPDSEQVLKTRGKVVWAEADTERALNTRCGIYFMMDQDPTV